MLLPNKYIRYQMNIYFLENLLKSTFLEIKIDKTFIKNFYKSLTSFMYMYLTNNSLKN